MTRQAVQPLTAPSSSPRLVRGSYTVPVQAPFRLDLTVSALRRLPTNTIDVLTAERCYLHALQGVHGPALALARQPTPTALEVTIDSDPADAAQHGQMVTLVGRSLGVDRELTDFYRAASTISWLDPLAERLRGLKPPRYRTLWEAFVNAVVYQQVSLHAASAVVQRIIEAFGTPLEREGVRVHLFPAAERVLAAPDATLRGLGLSAGKLATLRRAADAIASGTLDCAMLERMSSTEAAARLRSIKGVGPWTATVILLRGFGRLDVFPMNDSGVARNIALAAGGTAPDVQSLLGALGAHQGMLYFHLLLARLEAKGEAGLPSIT